MAVMIGCGMSRLDSAKLVSKLGFRLFMQSYISQQMGTHTSLSRDFRWCLMAVSCACMCILGVANNGLFVDDFLWSSLLKQVLKWVLYKNQLLNEVDFYANNTILHNKFYV